MGDSFEPSVNEMMKRALAVPLSGGAVIRPPRLTAPRLVSEPQLETGLDREARERSEEIQRLERMLER